MKPRLSILTFPQRFDGTRLHVNVLVVPRLSGEWNGNPLLSLPTPGGPETPFADADLQLEARALDGFGQFPSTVAPDFTAALSDASGVAADARALFVALTAPGAGRFAIDPGSPRLAEDVKPEIFIKKKLPRSYRDAFLFVGPRTRDAVTDDSYECAIKADKDINPAFKVTPDTVSWGQVYAYCLRHPQLARRIGLIRSASFAIQNDLFKDGGYLYVTFAAGSDYATVAADESFHKRYAARIPPLTAGSPREVFAAVLFPVVFDDPNVPAPAQAPGTFDDVFVEAAEYDDGFAKIVHSTQPVSQNLLAEEPDGITPLTDIGIRLGWDDEQILIWQNRQLKEDPTVPKNPGDPPQRLDAPPGVFGYRIDARVHESGDDWHSLTRVRSKAPLELDGIALGDPPDEPFDGELPVEVHPQQLDGNQATGQFWLPAYLTQWNGTSLVLPDENAAALFRTEAADGPKAKLGKIYEPVGLDGIPLRHGTFYDFRVRLMDATGGGPGIGAKAIYEAPAPETSLRFLRHVVPEPVRIADLPRFPDDELDAFFTGNSLSVERPLLGYPSVVFTGKYANPMPLLQAAATAAAAKQETFGIPDPDVQRVQIDVEVRALRMDNKMSLSKREAYIHLYSTERDFPADFTQPRVIPLDFRQANVLTFGEVDDLGDLGVTKTEINGLNEIVLPRGRDIRLTIRAVATANPLYFAPGAHIGKPVQLRVRRDSQDETELIADFPDSKKIRALFLQPDPVPVADGTLSMLVERTTGGSPAIIQRLAQPLGVENRGMTLVGKRGERVVFGCSRRIRHTLAPDHSSITFAAKEDLVNHWIVAVTLVLDRDWTWDGLAPVSFEIFRKRRFTADVEVDNNGGKPVGDWEILPTAPLPALDKPDRDHTLLVFLDAVEPKSDRPLAGQPGETRFPDTIELEYRVEPRFRVAPAATDVVAPLTLTLPVTTRPSQVPRIVSAGIALSKYERNPQYSATEPRRKMLWLELEAPPRDPHDAYFIRLLGYAADPLLSDNRFETLIAPEEPPLPIDPELVREISPSQSDDNAGLAAMIPLIASDQSNRHYLVPLPPGMNSDSAELFGFFTYELRVGHMSIWSTAQGRFGRPLRTTGVQHPAPTLFCTCQRDDVSGLLVEAPYAEAVLHGRKITAQPPRTQIWALLYAQVRQADGKDYRNILLDDRLLVIPPREPRKVIHETGRVLEPFENVDRPVCGVARWTNPVITHLLRMLGLPDDSPLSVICVELMPALNVQHEAPAGSSIFRADFDQAREHIAAGGASTLTAVSQPPQPAVRPLSDALGHYRILRTSPLTEVPAICCTTC
jgi:hypothetical protein